MTAVERYGILMDEQAVRALARIRTEAHRAEVEWLSHEIKRMYDREEEEYGSGR